MKPSAQLSIPCVVPPLQLPSAPQQQYRDSPLAETRPPGQRQIAGARPGDAAQSAPWGPGDRSRSGDSSSQKISARGSNHQRAFCLKSFSPEGKCCQGSIDKLTTYPWLKTLRVRSLVCFFFLLYLPKIGGEKGETSHLFIKALHAFCWLSRWGAIGNLVGKSHPKETSQHVISKRCICWREAGINVFRGSHAPSAGVCTDSKQLLPFKISHDLQILVIREGSPKILSVLHRS